MTPKLIKFLALISTSFTHLSPIYINWIKWNTHFNLLKYIEKSSCLTFKEKRTNMNADQHNKNVNSCSKLRSNYHDSGEYWYSHLWQSRFLAIFIWRYLRVPEANGNVSWPWENLENAVIAADTLSCPSREHKQGSNLGCWLDTSSGRWWSKLTGKVSTYLEKAI